MHPKIRSFLSRRSSILKVSGQVAKFHEDTITVVGIDFIYKLRIPGVKIIPSIYVNIQDLTSILSVLGTIEEAKRVDRKLLLKHSFIKAELPIITDNVMTTVTQITEGDTLLFGDDFYTSLVDLFKFFTPSTIYFPTKEKVVLHDEGLKFLAIINTEVPEDVIGSFGAVSSNLIFVDSFTPVWQVIPSTWHIVLGQESENEKFYTIFSAMAAIDLEKYAPIANLLDEIEASKTISIEPDQKLIQASSYPLSSVKFEGKDVILSSETFNLKFEGVLESQVNTSLAVSSWQALVPKAKGYSLSFLPDKKYLQLSSETFRIYLPA